MPITFNHAVSTWAKAMETKDLGDIDFMLCDDEFSWDSINGASSISKQETMNWISNTEMKIGDFTTIFDGKDVICGTHTVIEKNRDESVVMCVIRLVDGGNKLGRWTITRGELYQNSTDPKLGFLL